MLDTRQGLIYDQSTWIDSSYYEFRRIVITLDDGNSVSRHITILAPNQKVNEITHTLAWGVPEIPVKATEAIEVMSKTEAEAADKPDSYSVGRWIGHATVVNLVHGLTVVGRHQAEQLGIVAGRSDQSIALLVTTKSDGKTAQTTVKLVNHWNQLHSGEEDTKNGYNIAFGFFASDMEAKALPGRQGIGYAQIWEILPDDTSMGVFAIEDSSSGNVPKVMYLVPDRPVM